MELTVLAPVNLCLAMQRKGFVASREETLRMWSSPLGNTEYRPLSSSRLVLILTKIHKLLHLIALPSSNVIYFSRFLLCFDLDLVLSGIKIARFSNLYITIKGVH